jgi:hypothetical protein
VLLELAGAGREAAVSEAAAKAAATAAADERRGAEDARERCAELAAASDERLTRLYALWKEVNEASAYLKGLRKKGTEGGGRDAQHELPR